MNDSRISRGIDAFTKSSRLESNQCYPLTRRDVGHSRYGSLAERYDDARSPRRRHDNRPPPWVESARPRCELRQSVRWRPSSIAVRLFRLNPRGTLVYVAPTASWARHRRLPWLRFRRRAGMAVPVKVVEDKGFGSSGQGRYRSGQTGQTVNLLLHSFGGSNPSLPRTKEDARQRSTCGRSSMVER